MSILNIRNRGNETGLVSLHKSLNASLGKHGSVAPSISTEAMNFVSVGGQLTDGAQQGMQDLATSLENMFKVAFGDSAVSQEGASLGFGGAGTDAQIEAATIIAAAVSGDAKAYHNRAMSTAVASQEGIDVIHPNSAAYPHLLANVSTEAFDATNIEQLKGYNVLFAFASAHQDEFSEAFFKTVTLNPDTNGLEVKLRRTVVYREVTHAQTGQYTGWEYHNLLDAVSDSSILLDDTTRIYPQVIVGDAKSEMLFADKTLIAPKEIVGNGGAKITTAPLRPGQDINLIGLSMNEKIPGKLDETDALNHAINVVKLYFKVVTANGTSVIPFDTTAFNGNNFLKSQQHRDRRVNLDFPITDLLVDGDTKDIAGNPAAALAFLHAAPFDNVKLKFRTTISGHGDLQFGSINVNPAAARIGEARTVDATDGTYDIIKDETTLDELNGKITSIELVGYEVKAFRANLNRRQLGLLIDSVEETVRYMIPLSAPISLRKPITDTATANDLAGPLNAIRLRNSLNAVTKLHEVRDTLRVVVPQVGYRSPTDPAPQIEGFGRLMVRPALHEETLNIADVISSPSSQHRYNDVVSVITNKVRYAVNAVYTESRYQPALDAINGTAGQKPTVIIGTDPTTAAYLMTEGDPRVVLNFPNKVVVSYDVRMRNQIVCTFARPNVSDVDVMSFGIMANIPELVTNAVLNYNGSNTEVTQVQARNLHVCLLPILVWLNIEGLEQAAGNRVEFGVEIN
jgi:hypothetical protein